ncbi:MAG: hypothetical protein AVDCRST_MAG91-3579, partial [uncultured Sphingomonadaceae bacterium]
APGMAAGVRGTFAPAHGEGVRCRQIHPEHRTPSPSHTPSL